MPRTPMSWDEWRAGVYKGDDVHRAQHDWSAKWKAEREAKVKAEADKKAAEEAEKEALRKAARNAEEAMAAMKAQLEELAKKPR